MTTVAQPCDDVGGDAFDYAVNGDIAHVALFDAVGHGSAGGMRSVVLASIALAAYRNARRAGHDLVATYHHIDDAVRAHDSQGLITGVLAELDQRTGLLKVISAGDPGGLVMQAGKVVKVLPTPTALPVPYGDERAPVVVEEALEPGDHLLLYADGITEAHVRPGGEQFGVDRLIDFTSKAIADRPPPPETTRRGPRPWCCIRADVQRARAASYPAALRGQADPVGGGHDQFAQPANVTRRETLAGQRDGLIVVGPVHGHCRPRPALSTLR